MAESLAARRVVRLNATLFPPSAYERAQWARFGLRPVEVEANTVDALIPALAGCDGVFVVSTALPAPVVESLDRCRVISRQGLGTDRIDVALAQARGILVTNVPTFCIEEQADHAMALLLALVRKLPQMARDMKLGEYGRAQEAARGNQRLAGRTLGLVGFGNSARLTARRAIGFGMRVIATRRRMGAEDPAAAALGVRLADLATVLAESDYVSLHLPLTAASRHIIDAAAIARMRPGAMLINTSRGALVDEPALEAALRAGHLSGAGLDTFEGVDVFAEHPPPPRLGLLELDCVIATPHVAAGSVQSAEDVARGSVENLVAVLEGRWPPMENVVNAGVVPRWPLDGTLA